MPPVFAHGRKVNSMTSISKFDSSVYSEEFSPVTSESEYDEVMMMMADDDFAGYGEWSASLDSNIAAESENFIAYKDGSVKHKAQPKAGERIGGIEI